MIHRIGSMILVAAVGLVASAAAQPGSIVNSQVKSTEVRFSNGRWYYAVGNSLAKPLRSFDPATHAVTTIPLFVATFSAGVPVHAAGDFEIIAARESTPGVSNGDTDNDDDVLVVRRISTGTITVVPLAIEPRTTAIAPDASIVAIVSSEHEQEADLDGDGVESGHVLLALNPATLASHVVAKIASNDVDFGTVKALDGGELVFPAREGEFAQDLNGDGDQLDIVMRVRRANGTIETIPVGLSSAFAMTVVPSGQRFSVGVSEPVHGVDLTGDGDLIDIGVRVLIDRATLTIQNTGLVGCCGSGASNSTHQFLVVSEAAISADQNGDGDTLDSVPLLLEFATGTTTLLSPSLVGGSQYAMTDEILAFERLENEAPPYFDWNEDGDTWDVVPFAYLLATDELVVVPIAMELPSSTLDKKFVAKNHLLVRASEILNGATDYNHDGDTSDVVLIDFDAIEQRARNLTRSCPKIGYFPSTTTRFGFSMSETADGGVDLNGDGQVGDDVAVIADLDSGTSFETGLAQYTTGLSVGTAPQSYGASSVIVVRELSQDSDLDGDGLKQSYVPLFHAPSSAGCGAFELYGTGCPSSAGRVPQLDMHGCAYPGGPVRLEISGGIPGQPAFLLFGGQAGSIPLPGDCALLLSPLLPFVVGPVSLTANGLLAGATLIATDLPAASIPGTLRLQAFLADPGLPRGYSASQGLSLTIAP